jgi:hypothetical protein
MIDAGLLDDVMNRADAGGLELTGGPPPERRGVRRATQSGARPYRPGPASTKD